MNEAELRAAAICGLCGNKVGHTGLPLFWRISIQRFGIDAGAVRRQAGLEMMLGSVGLAQVMGAGEQMAKPMMDKVELSVCEDCALGTPMPVAVMAEHGPTRQEQEG